MNATKKGHLILVMAPMGSGKGSLIAHVESVFPQVTRITSCTTRAMRPGEQEGKDYCFVGREDFEEKIARGEFIEWAEFSNNLYGTLRSELMHRLEKGEIVINEIDMQGVQALRNIVPKEQCTVIYIDAGDWETLKARAIARAPISPEHLELRHQRFLEERVYKDQADYIIENRDGQFDDAKEHMKKIMQHIISMVTSPHAE